MIELMSNDDVDKNSGFLLERLMKFGFTAESVSGDVVSSMTLALNESILESSIC